VEKAIAVPILTPEHLWRTFQAEAENILMVDGSLEGNDRERNKRINAAYARLWLADNRFQWAGLAAFASQQLGCGLLHSAETIGRNRRQRESLQCAIAAAMQGGEAPDGVQAGTALGAAYMDRKLGFGTAHLFLEMYPLHRFYMERGWEEFSACLPRRQNEKYAVHWAVDRNRLRFGTPFVEIRTAFEQITHENLALGVESLARHEQVNILQPVMYDDEVLRKLLAMNQYAWTTGFPTGDYAQIQLTLSAECRARTGFASWFSRFSQDTGAKLWLAAERMPFVHRAAGRFNQLLNSSERPRVEASLRAIAAGAGDK
jgi:hypothetical protein